MSDVILPAWYADHVKIHGDISAPQFAFIITRPRAVQQLFLRFPPGCVVRHVPTGDFGVAKGFVAGDTDKPGMLVAPNPRTKDRAHWKEHPLDEIEVVGFWNGVDGPYVEGILDAARPVEVLSSSRSRIGRNDPCPCSSGKKFKWCCMNLGGKPPVVGQEKLN